MRKKLYREDLEKAGALWSDIEWRMGEIFYCIANGLPIDEEFAAWVNGAAERCRLLAEELETFSAVKGLREAKDEG